MERADNLQDFQSMAVVAISDSNYASRCAAMIESAQVQDAATVLSLDESGDLFRKVWPELHVVKWHRFLEDNPEISLKIGTRSRSEQIFSVGPSFLMSQSPNVAPGGWLVYADSDLYFFQPLEKYLEHLSHANVVIVPHRHYHWNKRRLAKFGHYNVGLVAFRNNNEGLKALSFWAESCLDWCLDRPEDGRYADQKYLEQFFNYAKGVHVENRLGANLAPWNASLRKVTLNSAGNLQVSGNELWYFHFQGVKRIKNRWVLGHLNYLAIAGHRLKRWVYSPYLVKIEEWGKRPGFEKFGSSRTSTTLVGRFTSVLFFGLSLLTGQTLRLSRNKLDRIQ